MFHSHNCMRTVYRVTTNLLNHKYVRHPIHTLVHTFAYTAMHLHSQTDTCIQSHTLARKHTGALTQLHNVTLYANTHTHTPACMLFPTCGLVGRIRSHKRAHETANAHDRSWGHRNNSTPARCVDWHNVGNAHAFCLSIGTTIAHDPGAKRARRERCELYS